MVDYKKEPITNVVTAPPRAMPRFTLGIAISTLLISSLLISISVFGNYHGYFGRLGQFEFYNGRFVKADYLTKLEAAKLPDSWIIGSSDTMSFKPSTVEEKFSTRKSFNLGSFWGRAEDMWAWTNFILFELKSTPKLVIFGVEPWSFANDQRGPPLYSRYRRRLISTPQLVKYLPEHSNWRFQASRLLDSLTGQNFRRIIRMTLRYGTSRVELTPINLDTPTKKAKNEKRYIVARSPFNLDGSNIGFSNLNPKPFLPPAVTTIYKNWANTQRHNALKKIGLKTTQNWEIIF